MQYASSSIRLDLSNFSPALAATATKAVSLLCISFDASSNYDADPGPTDTCITDGSGIGREEKSKKAGRVTDICDTD